MLLINRWSLLVKDLEADRLIGASLRFLGRLVSNLARIARLLAFELNGSDGFTELHLRHLFPVILYLSRLVQLRILGRGLAEHFGSSLAWRELSECGCINGHLMLIIVIELSLGR